MKICFVQTQCNLLIIRVFPTVCACSALFSPVDCMFTSSSHLSSSRPPEAPVYQAASPDEEALVSAARELGWVFLSRTRDSVVVSELGVTRQYQLLALLGFTSQRRRMSVLGQSRFFRLPLMSKYLNFLFVCFAAIIIFFSCSTGLLGDMIQLCFFAFPHSSGARGRIKIVQ